jgi:hypothetical protein
MIHDIHYLCILWVLKELILICSNFYNACYPAFLARCAGCIVTATK